MPVSTTRLAGLNRALFHPGQRLCCALSGGADSTALLLALLEANAEKDSLGLVLTAIHVHHGLRGPEADADAAFVRFLCAHRNIPLTVQHVNTPARQQAEHEGLEEAARELRYGAFRTYLAQNHADAIATAHTLDDQAETVLMKLLRGAWTEGLGGIAPLLRFSEPSPTSGVGAPHLASEMWVAPGNSFQPKPSPHSATILRPMLTIRRTEVEHFLRERHQAWREDTSNADLTLTRNRVRHQLMPLLRTFNPAIDENLARTAVLAREDQAYWQTEVARVLPGLILVGRPVRGGGRAVSTAPSDRSLAVEIDRLKPKPAALQRRLLRSAAAELGVRLDAVDTTKLLALAGLTVLPGLTTRNGTRLDLGHGLRAERSLREIRLCLPGNSGIPKKM